MSGGVERRPAWAIIVHGGAKEIVPEQEEVNRAGCLTALAAGRALLERDGTAVAAVEAALRVLEDDPTFNAGYGSVLNAADEVEMDAAVMDGRTLDVGAVAGIKGVRHPVSVAGLLLGEGPTLLVGDGARAFAAERGAELCDPAAMITPAQTACEARRGHDTVGCIALDTAGNLAAGTSTGGLQGTLPGRVGDSPLPGCGFYADNAVGAAAFSGDGEGIARTLLVARVMQALEAGRKPQDAVHGSLAQLGRVGGEAGGITLDPQGRIGFAHNSSHFVVAWMSDSMGAPRVCLRQSDEV
jgi:beta-aspartyl-peptidase (threonine type)